MTTPMRLALAITADASGVAPATAEVRREIDRLEDEVRGATGALTAHAAANDRVAAASRRAEAAIRGQGAAETQLRATVRAGGGFGTANIAAQFQDIGVTAAAGMSPVQIALQQGTQLSAVFNDLKASGQGVGTALAAAFGSIVNPVSLVTLGVVGLTSVAIQYFSTWMAGSDETELSLKEQADLVQEVAKRWGDALPQVKAYADELQRTSDLADARGGTAATISNEYRQAETALAAFLEQVRAADFSAFDAGAMATVDDIAMLRYEVGELEAAQRAGQDTSEEFARVQTVISDILNSSAIPATGGLRDTVNQLSEAYREAAESAGAAADAQRLLDERGGIPVSDVAGGRGSDPRDIERDPYWRSRYLPDPERAARPARAPAISEAEREAKAVAELIEQLEFENSLIGASAVERERLTALRRAGAAATDEQKKKISDLITANHAETEALKQQEAAFKALQSVGTTAINGLVNAFRDGKLEGQELLAIVIQIIQQLMSMPAGAGGLLQSLLGGGLGNFVNNALFFNPSPTGFMDMIMDSGGTILGGNVVPFGPKTRQLKNGIIADSGFGPRHFKAVLEEGETVLTRQDTNRAMNVFQGAAAMAGGMGGGVLRVILEPNEMFDARVEEVSGRISEHMTVEGIKAYDRTSQERFNRDARRSKRHGAR